MAQLGHTGVCVGRGERCGWVSEWGEGEIHVQERSMLIQMLFTRIIPHSPRVTVCWTREKVPPIRCSLIGEPTRTCIVGHSHLSPRW